MCAAAIAAPELDRQRHEMAVFNSGPVIDWSSSEKLPQGCILKELLPEKLFSILKGVAAEGVQFTFAEPNSGGLFQVELERLIGKRFLLPKGAALVFPGCRLSVDVADEMHRRMNSSISRESVMGISGCRLRTDFPQSVQKLIRRESGRNGLEVKQGINQNLCGGMASSCKSLTQDEFQALFNAKPLSPISQYALASCKTYADQMEDKRKQELEELLQPTGPDLKRFLGDIKGDWCGESKGTASSGAATEHVVFTEENGRILARILISWSTGILDTELIPLQIKEIDGIPSVILKEHHKGRKMFVWTAKKTDDGWELSDGANSPFQVTRDCAGFSAMGSSIAVPTDEEALAAPASDLLKDLHGEFCGKAADGSNMQLRVMFNEDFGGLTANGTKAWGYPFGAYDYSYRLFLAPVSFERKDGSDSILLKEVSLKQSGATWRARKTQDGWNLLSDRSFNMTTACGGFWREENGPIWRDDSNLSRLAGFEILDVRRPIPPHTPVTIKVNLKQDFDGTARFYSCDDRWLRLVDIPSGEYIASRTYQIHAKSGFIAKFNAEYSDPSIDRTPPICGEFKWGQENHGTKYSAQLIGTEKLTVATRDDWYYANIGAALDRSDSFPSARIKKLLTDPGSQEIANAVAQRLPDWFSSNKNKERADELASALLANKWGKYVVAVALQLLERDYAFARLKGIALLTACGPDADSAASAVKNLLHIETDPEVQDKALQLSRARGFDIAPKFLKPEEITSAMEIDYKKEIKAACELAASIDLTQKDQYNMGYDDNGNRIPVPENANKAIRQLEKLVYEMPDYPEMDQVYLLLGRLKLRFENEYQEPILQITQDDEVITKRGVPPEIRGKLAEYQLGECSGGYYYNGYHFDRLLTLFPGSSLAGAATSEKGKVIQPYCD